MPQINLVISKAFILFTILFTFTLIYRLLEKKLKDKKLKDKKYNYTINDILTTLKNVLKRDNFGMDGCY